MSGKLVLPGSSRVHVCIVARDPVANLAPVLDRRFDVRQVVLIHTGDFLCQAKNLARAYRRYGIQSRFFCVSSAFDAQLLRQELSGLFVELLEIGPMVNITAGTKLLSLVLYQLALEAGFPVYYVKADDHLLWLAPDGLQALQLQDRVSLEAFLMAQGLRLLSERAPFSQKVYRDLLDKMAGKTRMLQKSLAQLNYYAATAGKNLCSAPLQNTDRLFNVLLGWFAQAGLARLKNNRLCFCSEQARFFANGGWLEEFLYHQIRQLSADIPQIQDYKMSVMLEDSQGRVKNEIDNLLLCNNHLFVIECKTKRFSRVEKAEGAASSAIYKLHTLKSRLGGMLAKAMLISAFPVSASDRERAKAYGIELLEVEDLTNIRSLLSRWLK